MSPVDRYSHTGHTRPKAWVVHNFPPLVFHFHLLLGVAVGQKPIHVRQHIEGNLMRIHFCGHGLPGFQGGDLLTQFDNGLGSRAGDSLIGRRKNASHMKGFVQGVERIQLKEFTQVEPYMRANVAVIPEKSEASVEIEALKRNMLDLFRSLVELMPHVPEEVVMAALNIEDPRQLVYQIASNMRLSIEDAQEILELDDVKDKLNKLTGILSRELEVVQLGQKIRTDAQSEMEKVQREYFLREQLKAIRRELGEEDEQAVEADEYRRKIAEANMPQEAEQEALRELSRMEKMPAAAAEYSVIKTYLDWMTSLPWGVSTDDNLDIAHARQVLDEDHYDLEEIKDRILEYLAVRKLKLEREGEEESLRSRGGILCFVGPPVNSPRQVNRFAKRSFGRVELCRKERQHVIDGAANAAGSGQCGNVPIRRRRSIGQMRRRQTLLHPRR